MSSSNVPILYTSCIEFSLKKTIVRDIIDSNMEQEKEKPHQATTKKLIYHVQKWEFR